MSNYYSGYSRPTRAVRAKRRQPAVSVRSDPPRTAEPRPEPAPAFAATPAVVERTNSSVPCKATARASKGNGQRLRMAGRRGGPSGRKRPTVSRPSLSEQLASIGAGASAITEGLRKRHGLEPAKSVLFTTPAMLFVVGRLESKMPSPVAWHHDHCAYSFQHPFQRGTRIDMEMRYGDMSQPAVRSDKIGGHFFEFKICAPLSCYGIDYDPGKREHKVKIRLASGTDVERVKTEILPRIRRS
eukprot:g1969.t1